MEDTRESLDKEKVIRSKLEVGRDDFEDDEFVDIFIEDVGNGRGEV